MYFREQAKVEPDRCQLFGAAFANPTGYRISEVCDTAFHLKDIGEKLKNTGFVGRS